MKNRKKEWQKSSRTKKQFKNIKKRLLYCSNLFFDIEKYGIKNIEKNAKKPLTFAKIHDIL